MTNPTVPEADRAKRIAEIRTFADWLELHAWIPVPKWVRASEHLNGHGSTVDEQQKLLARLQQLADNLGTTLNETLHDRTRLELQVGEVDYDLLVWHENGRPGELDPRDAELERLRAEVAELRAAQPPAYERDLAGAGQPGPRPEPHFEDGRNPGVAVGESAR